MDIIMNKTPFSCRYAAQEVGYSILYKNPTDVKPFPLLKSNTGNAPLYNICPATHCRSFIVAKTDDRFIVSKGNGLSYTEWTFLNTGEFGDDTLGLLLKKDALRDFHIGNEIASLGIRTNRMEYVLELNTRVTLPNGNTLKPILLQYDVACPYRIADARFMTEEMIKSEVDKWETANIKHHDKKHMVAAEILVNNLRMHSMELSCLQVLYRMSYNLLRRDSGSLVLSDRHNSEPLFLHIEEYCHPGAQSQVRHL